MKSAHQALFRLKRYIYEDYKNIASAPDPDYLDRFVQAMNHDLDTPQAIGLLFEIAKDNTLTPAVKCATMQAIDTVLDIGLRDPIDTALVSLGVVKSSDLPQSVQALVTAREAARAAKDWTKSDQIRAEINLLGYAVEDTPLGIKVTKAS